MVGVAPFGLVTGITAREAGYGLPAALGLSGLISAGAAQLAVIDLLTQGTPVVAVVLTVVAINIRMTMYSATLAPHLADVPLRTRAAAAALITDHVFAVTATAFSQEGADDRRPAWFLMGAGAVMWTTWQLANATGHLLATQVPAAFPVGFAIPITFLALLVPAVTDRPRLAAALVGGVVALLASGLPANLGIGVGLLVGVCAGVLVTTTSSRDRGPQQRRGTG